MAISNTRKSVSPRKYWLADNWLRVIVHIGAWLPFVWLAWNWSHHTLGVDPVTTINNVSGRTAMILLLLCLSATPVCIITDFRQALKVRRALGLYAFMYAALHFANFVALDYGFDLQFILDDGIQTKPYILAGFSAFLILGALAVTSTKGWQRRMRRNWTRLHWLIYPAGLLVMLHFIWQAKAAEKWEPLIYATVLGLILLVRVPPIRRTIVKWRYRQKPPAPQKAARAVPIPTNE